MAELKNIQRIIELYVQDYNKKLGKNLLLNEDFFGDTLRLIDFLNHYYDYLIKEKDEQRISFVIEQIPFIRKYITGLTPQEDSYTLSVITDDEYRQANKGVLKVRKLIPSISEKRNTLGQALSSYKRYEEEFKNQVYMVYTNDNIYNFELKEEYLPPILGLNLEDQVKDVYTMGDKEKEYYQKLPGMLEKMCTNEGIMALDTYEHKNFHSLFNYSYVKTKNISFQHFMNLRKPMLVISNHKKVDSNVKTSTFFATPILVGKSSSYSIVGFHENSKFSKRYAESKICKKAQEIKGEYGITTSIFRQNKILPPHHFELVRLFTISEQVNFINEVLNHPHTKNLSDLKQYQDRLKRSLYDQINLEYKLEAVLKEHTKVI